MIWFKVHESSLTSYFLHSSLWASPRTDPCLLSKCNDDNVVMIGIYVDDCLVMGKDELIQEVI
jgi:hypothetical protein